MNLTLDLPDYLPEWATAVGRTLGPGDVGGPSAAQIANGWDDDTKPPARWMNWLHNATFDWLRRLAIAPVCTWFTGDQITVNIALGSGFAYHPAIKKWAAFDGTNYVVSLTGDAWGSTAALATSGYPGIDQTKFIVGDNTTGLRHSVDGSTWLNDTAPAGAGITGKIMELCTKYPSSDFLMVGDINGKTAIAASGVGTSWAAPSTPLTPSTTYPEIKGLLWLSGSVWAAVSREGDSWLSLDDGDTWAAMSNTPKSLGNITSALTVGHNHKSGRLIVGGNDNGPSPQPSRMYYTDDNGATSWIAATMHEAVDTASVGSTIHYVKYIGGGLWVACGDFASSSNLKVWLSYDDGANWYPAQYMDIETRTVSSSFYAIATDGKRLICSGSNQTVYSLAVPGLAE